MIEAPSLGLRIVAAKELPKSARTHLKPGTHLKDPHGIDRRLPSHFYEIPSWEAALDTKLAPHFGIWELIDVDLREPKSTRLYPRYVPCALGLLASHLELLRSEVGRVVRVAANGGYRSPSHRFSTVASPHIWGTAANIYRIGDELLDSKEKIEKYIEVARRVMPTVWVRPYGEERGYAFDHLHLDLGYLEVEPHGTGGA